VVHAHLPTFRATRQANPQYLFRDEGK